MNWDAIGAIGEVVGAAAVVITLIFLIREMSKNAKAIDTTSSRDVSLGLSNWHLKVASDPELKRIVLKAAQPTMEAFTAEEWYGFTVLALSLMHLYQTHYIHSAKRVGDEEEFALHMRLARSVVNLSPAYKKFWDEQTAAGVFLQGFIDAVNGSDAGPNIRFYVEGKPSEDSL